MHIITVSEEIEDLLSRFRKAGGVVEYDFAAPEPGETVDTTAHRQAILLSHARWDEEFKAQRKAALRYVQTNKAYRQNYPPDRVEANERQYAQDAEMGMAREPNKLLGESITSYQFLGRAFELGYLPRQKGPKFDVLRPDLLDMREELKRLNVPIQPDSTFENGYAYAFSNPPYNLQADAAVRLQIFRGLNHFAFNDFGAGTQIFQWSTDWSRFFAEGDEWWGSFLWTVYNPVSKLVVVVAASATD